MQVLRDEFGSDSVGFYSADTFNEMAPPTDDPAYLRSITEAIYKVCWDPALGHGTDLGAVLMLCPLWDHLDASRQ